MTTPASPVPRTSLPDLAPARWIWYPSGRTLPSTFVLFRRAIHLAVRPRRALGWICADSRYQLQVNGQRVQFGPAPADPRWPEADPLDLAEQLHAGDNVLGAQVLFYGQGDGTWPIGKPGFLFWLELEFPDGTVERVVSDPSWQACLARSWPIGHAKRWYLRALQEEFDARLYPYGWSGPDFKPDADWLAAMVLEGSPNKPAVCTHYPEYQLDLQGDPAHMQLRPRSIPLLREFPVAAKGLVESAWLEWQRSPFEYFAVRTPNSYREIRSASAVEVAPGKWQVKLTEPPAPAEKLASIGGGFCPGQRGAVLTFDFEEQVVGWPYFTIEAPAGTVVELLVQEAHQPGGPVLMNSHFDAWTRFTCKAGENRFETFDFESLRWLQLHLHGEPGEVRVSNVGLRRRVFPWPNQPEVRCGEPALQRLLDASINTLNNCAQETCVDGMGRERQQYSGDGAHQLHGIYYAFGERRLPARYLTTFSQGLTLEGYFLDCWPAYDRLARLVERQLQLTGWGPLLDHGVGFNFDCWYYYLYTGDADALREPLPRLLRFAQYLKSIQTRSGLLPVENLGVPSVWIDHVAFQRQRHKQCAFNLYTAAMLEHALAPVCRALGDTVNEQSSIEFGRELLGAAIRNFWSDSHGLFVNNLPWLEEEKSIRLCDRSLATSVLFNQCPKGDSEAALKALAECPPAMGFSYPANAGWRLWALAKGGRIDVVLKDLRGRWAPMQSVLLNNTLQEDWQAQPDSGSQWSHCAIVPLYVLFMSVAGIRPLSPGFKRCEVFPQLGDLAELDLTAFTPHGPLRLRSRGKSGARHLSLSVPDGCEVELVLREQETVELEPVDGRTPRGYARYLVPAGLDFAIDLKH